MLHTARYQHVPFQHVVSSNSSQRTIRQSPRGVCSPSTYSDGRTYLSNTPHVSSHLSHSGLSPRRSGSKAPSIVKNEFDSVSQTSVTSSSKSSQRTVREASLKQVQAEQQFLREEELIEEELSKLRLKKLEEEAEEEMNAKKKEIEARKRKLKYEEQERMFERRRRELELQCEKDCLDAEAEGSVTSLRSIHSGKSVSSQLGYPKTSNEAAQNFQSRCSEVRYSDTPKRNMLHDSKYQSTSERDDYDEDCQDD